MVRRKSYPRKRTLGRRKRSFRKRKTYRKKFEKLVARKIVTYLDLNSASGNAGE